MVLSVLQQSDHRVCHGVHSWYPDAFPAGMQALQAEGKTATLSAAQGRCR